MDSLYLRGWSIVAFVVIVSAMVCLVSFRPASFEAPAGQDLGEAASRLGSFRFTERSGVEVTDATLADRVWIASFIFSRCPLSCPRITSIMKGLQSRFEDGDALLVSISVDPDYDTPEVLADYANRYGADPNRWWFLTGDRDATFEMINKKFLLAAMPNPSPDPEGLDEAILHSDRLALVDRGVVVGVYDSNDAAALEALVKQANLRALPKWLRLLPALNASLNGLCAVLLLIGWNFARRARRSPIEPSAWPPARGAASRFIRLLRLPATRGHVIAMSLAVVASACFLTSYLIYHYHVGSVGFRGLGVIRWVYLTILLSHSLLAALGVAPLVALALFRAFRGDFIRHARVARLLLPIWLYVSVTGVVIYLMLHHLPAFLLNAPVVASA